MKRGDVREDDSNGSKGQSMKRFVAVLACVMSVGVGSLGAGCGGEEEQTVVTEEETTGAETREERDDGVEVEGLMGTIRADEVERGVQTRMLGFQRCFQQRYDAVEMLGGHFQMAFRVRRDGTVLWVYPKASTVGDRPTERCLLDAAAEIHFPRPHGGEAEFSYSLELDPLDDVRPAEPWDPAHVSTTIAEEKPGLVESCGEGAWSVTAYVAPGGEVMAVGAASDELDVASAEHLDCVTQTVASWTLPDPGSYPAKVTFAIR